MAFIEDWQIEAIEEQSAKKLEWRDETSYSRRDKERIPRTWSIGNMNSSWDKHLQITVTHMVYDPEGWYLNCHKLGMSELPLKSKDLEDAKQEALDRVGDCLETLLGDFKDICRGNVKK